MAMVDIPEAGTKARNRCDNCTYCFAELVVRKGLKVVVYKCELSMSRVNAHGLACPLYRPKEQRESVAG